MGKSITYKDSGVDIDAGDAFARGLKKINPAIGGFGGLISIPRGMTSPRLVASTDGVGSKILIADELKQYDTIGIDLVAMVVNDIIAMGAQPTAFLDYYAVESLRTNDALDIMRGITEGCNQAGCDLVGGETAELPGIYPKGGFDLAGFGVGFVEKRRVIDGSSIRPGDVVIGLPSSGIHSNGYSLARRVLLETDPEPKGKARRAILEQMLRPTSIYVKPILKLLKKVNVRGIAHITGGGIPGNLVRVLPPKCQAVIDTTAWDRPEIFELIQAKGPVDSEEMYRVFNMGIGMCVVVPEKQVTEAIKILRRSLVHAIVIGYIKKGATRVVLNGLED